MEVTEWKANGTIRKGRARRMEKEVPRRPWWRGGTGGRKKGEEDERPAQAASRQRLLAISRHSQRTLATRERFVKDGLKNIRTKKRRREEPAEDAVTWSGECFLREVITPPKALPAFTILQEEVSMIPSCLTQGLLIAENAG